MIDTAIDLMRAYGLSGTGINDIVRESGAPKGSMYHFFPGGKAQIAAESLSLYAERVGKFMDDALSGQDRPEDKVRALFAAFANRVEHGRFLQSCAVGAVSLDLGEDDDTIRGVVRTALAKWEAILAKQFDLGSQQRSESFAGLLLTAIEGAYIRCRAERSSAPFLEAGGWISELLARS